MASFACVRVSHRPPILAPPSHGSWPNRELHRRPQWRRSRASAPLIDPHCGTPLTRFVAPRMAATGGEKRCSRIKSERRRYENQFPSAKSSSPRCEPRPSRIPTPVASCVRHASSFGTATGCMSGNLAKGGAAGGGGAGERSRRRREDVGTSGGLLLLHLFLLLLRFVSYPLKSGPHIVNSGGPRRLGLPSQERSFTSPSPRLAKVRSSIYVSPNQVSFLIRMK